MPDSPLTINEVADHPHDPPPPPDLRTDLQKTEEAERAAYAVLPVTGKVKVQTEILLSTLRAQAKVNGPVTPWMIAVGEEILALVR